MNAKSHGVPEGGPSTAPFIYVFWKHLQPWDNPSCEFYLQTEGSEVKLTCKVKKNKKKLKDSSGFVHDAFLGPSLESRQDLDNVVWSCLCKNNQRSLVGDSPIHWAARPLPPSRPWELLHWVFPKPLVLGDQDLAHGRQRGSICSFEMDSLMLIRCESNHMCKYNPDSSTQLAVSGWGVSHYRENNCNEVQLITGNNHVTILQTNHIFWLIVCSVTRYN